MRKRKDFFKRFTAFAVSLVTLFSVMPFETVYANYQKYVSNVTIKNMASDSSVYYSINIGWTNPSQWSSIADSEATEPDTLHSPEGFRVEGRNLTAGERTYDSNVIGKVFTDDNLKAIGRTVGVEINPALTTGSIYGYRVMPYHYHRYEQSNGTYTTGEAPYDSSSTSLEEVLYMSDIQVEAEGSGNYLNVTWDNPQLLGKNVFSGYKIYYQRGGASVTALGNGRTKTINIDDEGLKEVSDPVRKGVKRLKYSIYDDELSQGDVYAVKVEPMYNGVEIRDLSKTGLSYANVVVSNVAYKMSFTDYKLKEYRTNDAYISIPLEINESGKDYLKLHWWGISNSSTAGNVSKIEIYSGTSEDDIGIKLGTLYSANAVDVNYWQVEKPSVITYYKLKIYLENMQTPLDSEIAVFDPNAVTITPNQPAVYLYGNNTTSKPSLDFYWDVFYRAAYTEEEEAFIETSGKLNGLYIDKNVVYDIWVTDTLDNIMDPSLPKAVESVSAIDLTATTAEGITNPVYYKAFSTYKSLENGLYTDKPIEENKVYYVKLVVTKPVEGGDDLAAQPVYASVYLQAGGEIGSPRAINKPPLEVEKDKEGIDVITNDSITVKWATKWYEVYDGDTDDWYSSAAITPDGDVVFGKDITASDTAIEFYSAYSEEKVKTIFSQAGVSEEKLNLMPIRQIDLTAEDIKYEIVAPVFEDVMSAGGYDVYLKNIPETAWRAITPNDLGEYYCDYKLEGLTKNTTYIIILRPYRMVSENKKDAYPTYVQATTLPDGTNVEITPTVPTLMEEGHTDMSISVYWDGYLSTLGGNLNYELVINTEANADPLSGGTHILNDTIVNEATQKTEQNEDGTTKSAAIHYTFKNLLPNTGYYIWVRAASLNNNETLYSDWSSPLYVVTDKLGIPYIPRGLGLVSKENIERYNSANNTEYTQKSSNYLILEWFKNANDTNTSGEGPSGTGYEILANSLITNTYIVKFNELVMNTPYYARVKATSVVTPATDGTITKSYFYTLQFSKTDDFKDAITVIVPEDLSANVSSKYVAESDWSRVVEFNTSKSDDEYDGDKDPNHYPLPKDDFEEYYEGSTHTLYYRFRFNEEDRDKLDDNYVDQRLISKLITNKTYDYYVDLTEYNSKTYIVDSRVVEMPYTVIDAFGEHKSTFTVRADNITYTFDPDFIETTEVKNMAGYGLGAKVEIKITSAPKDVPVIGYNEGYSTNPQRLSIKVITPSRTLDVTNLAENVKVSLKLNDRYSLLDSNVGAYIYAGLDSAWTRAAFNYDNVAGTYTFSTKRVGAYSVIKKNVPSVANSDTTVVNSFVNVASRINVTDMQSYNPQAAVSTVQFNNVVAAVAKGNKDVAINGALDNNDYIALSRKGIALNTANVTREQGIDALVKLYETKTGRLIEYYTPLANTTYKDIASASPTYQTSLLKAGFIGFFNNTYGARPKDTMSLADLFYIIDIIMQDSGM